MTLQDKLDTCAVTATIALLMFGFLVWMASTFVTV